MKLIMKLIIMVLFLFTASLITGFNIGSVEASTITVGGSMNLNGNVIVGGGKKDGTNSSVWQGFDEMMFELTHVHPKISMEISDNASGELLLCFSERHPGSVWVASMEYLPIAAGYGNTPIAIVVGRFMVPFGDYNIAGVMPENLKTESRPLMYVDHSQMDMQLNNGPSPILVTPYFDDGILLYGNVWLRKEQDQLWYGFYLVNGTVDRPTGATPSLDPNVGKQIGGRISYSFGELLGLGLSYLTEYVAEDNIKNAIYGADFYITLGKINLLFEYAENPFEDWSTMPRSRKTKRGGFVQIDFPFTLFFGEESNFGNKFGFAAMVSALSFDGDKPNHTFTDMYRGAVTLSFFPDPAIKYKLEYQYTMLGKYNDNISNVSTYGRNFDKYLSKIQLGFGLSF